MSPLGGSHVPGVCTLYWLGEFTSARLHLEQEIALYDPQQHPSLTLVRRMTRGWFASSFASWTLWILVIQTKPGSGAMRHWPWPQELSHPFSLAYALGFAAWFHLLRREGQLAQERAEAVITLSTEQGFPYWLAVGTIVRGGALAEQGQEEEGIAQIRQGMAAYRATGAELWRSYFLALLAEAYGKVGQVEEGLSVLAEALAMVDKTGERYYEAELYRLKGS